MKQATSTIRRVAGALSLGAALFVLSASAGAQAPAQPAASPFSRLSGIVMDSIHGVPLAEASVVVEGTTRAAITNADGRYAIDSIPPGNHRVIMLHPLLDTLGMIMRSQAYPFGAGEAHDLDLTVPAPDRLVGSMCNAIWRSRGPAALMGFVRDPDTKKPADGAKVELVYYENDLAGRKQLRVRPAAVDSVGHYMICGLPGDMAGKVQLTRNGVLSGEVEVAITNGFLALRSFTIAQAQTVVEVKSDSGKVKRVARGSARVTGKIVNKAGEPLRDARVSLQGSTFVVLSKNNGEFVLDSLPSGTQQLEVRKLGYDVKDVAVELSSNEPARANVTMSDAVPVLATMRVEATEDRALAKLGYLERKKTGMGYFFDGNQLNHQSLVVSDMLRVSPGLMMSPSGDGRTNVIQDSRNPANGCVNVYVDGFKWTDMAPGDLDNYIHPSDVVAVEVYHGSETPAEFQTNGQTSCATIVIWTIAKVSVSGGDNSKKKP